LNHQKGLVIDPYAGSGTTLVAAKLLGHNYVGIEISDEYRRMALERISNSFLERGNLEQEIQLHGVITTFNEYKSQGRSKPRSSKQKRLV
jgi:DNA modification methylase